jgi:hypothetical protein
MTDYNRQSEQKYEQNERTESQSQLTRQGVNNTTSTKEYYRNIHEQQKRRATATMDDINRTIGSKK